MNTRLFTKIVRTTIAVIFILGTVLGPTTTKVAAQDVPNTNIVAYPLEDRVQALNWPMGSTITLTINGTDYGSQMVNSYAPWDQDQVTTFAEFFFSGSHDLVPEDTVTISGGSGSNTYKVAILEITSVDSNTDTVYGIAPANAYVEVLCDDPCNIRRHVQADNTGHWSANLSVLPEVPDEGNNWPTIYDIRGGEWFGAQQWNEQGNGVSVAFHLPNPHILANPKDHWVYGFEWPLDTEITLSVGDYSPTTTMTVTPWDPNGYYAYFDMTGHDLNPGDILTMTDGNVTKTYQIADFAVTNLDVAADMLSGRASPGAAIQACSDNGCRSTTAGLDGMWSMGPDPASFVLKPGVGGWAHETDPYGNGTETSWSVPNPRFEVRANGDLVRAWEWTVGETLTLQVKGQTFTATVQPTTPWGSNEAFAEFNLYGQVDIQPGDMVSLTNGTIIKTTTVTELAITGYDWNADTISGIAKPNTELGVWACDAIDCPYRHVIAQGDGTWVAYFGTKEPGTGNRAVDIVPGMGGDSQQLDEDGDSTEYGWSLPNPRFDVRANNDQVQAWEWTVGETLTLQVKDKTFTASVQPSTPWGSNEAYAEFNLSGKVDIQPGDAVTLSNGTITKTTVITDLAFTDINVEADTVTGVATTDIPIDLWICDSTACYNRHVAEVDGTWTADFAHPGSQPDEQTTFDIVNGTWIDSRQGDEDSDATMFGQSAIYPTITVAPKNHWIDGWRWPLGTDVTLNVDGYSDTVQAITESGDPADTIAYFGLPENLDLQPGDVVTVTGSGITKTLIVTNFAVTILEVESNTLSGTASPGAGVYGCADNAPGGCRSATADDNGNWTMSDDPNGFVLAKGVYGWAAEADKDGDENRMDWHVPNPRLIVQLTKDWFRVEDFTPNATLTYKIYSHKDGPLMSSGTIQSDNRGWVNQVETYVDLVPGNYIKVTDGTISKDIILEDVKFDTLDLTNGLASGSAPPPAGRYVWLGVGTATDMWTVDLNTDSNNHWSGNVNAQVPMNFQWAAAQVFDEDGDGSEVRPALYLTDVSIDIRPWIDPNPVLCRSVNELVPVAVLSTPEFDATTLDPWSVRFGKTGTEAAVAMIGRTDKPMKYVADVNKDGLPDIVFSFRFGGTGLSCSDIPAGQYMANVTAALTGKFTYTHDDDGIHVVEIIQVDGSDVLTLVKILGR